jgi:hypothetical protein
MLKIMKRKNAFELMLKNFGPWKTWGRVQHLAYGLLRGVPYSKMERCSNDNPPEYLVGRLLYEIGAFEQFPPPKKEPGKYYSTPGEINKFMHTLIVWVKKQPRTKKNVEVV